MINNSLLKILIIVYIGIIYSTLYMVRGIEQTLIAFFGNADYKIFINGLLLVSGLIVLYFAVRRGFKNFLFTLIPLAIIAYLSFVMRIPSEKIHFIEYGLLGILVYKVLSQKSILYILAGFAFIILVGFFDEVIQYYLPNRVFDWRDVRLNTISGALGLWAAKALYSS